MPIYVYEPLDQNCHICKGRFELNRPLSRPPLTHCPLCKKPVRQIITPFSTPKITKPFSLTDAKKAGFTVLERKDKGVYEKL
jgi:putative FmdB family regulatory protein